MDEEPMLKFFNFDHLPDHLKPISSIFHDAAYRVVALVPRSAERTASLRKLLEAKDAGVMAFVYKE